MKIIFFKKQPQSINYYLFEKIYTLHEGRNNKYH
jgi:hypothetical protein